MKRSKKGKNVSSLFIKKGEFSGAQPLSPRALMKCRDLRRDFQASCLSRIMNMISFCRVIQLGKEIKRIQLDPINELDKESIKKI